MKNMWIVKNKIKMIMLGAIVLLAWGSPVGAVNKEVINKHGNTLYTSGEFQKAVDQYRQAFSKDPESPIINFNLGTGLYQLGEYQKAIGHLQKSLLSEDSQLRQKAYYNLGNTYFQEGLSQEEQSVSAAIVNLEEALSYYESVLKMDDKDEDAKYNHTIVEQELVRLKKKQEEEQKKEEQEKKEEHKNTPQDEKEQEQKAPEDSSAEKKEEPDEGESKPEPQNPEKENQPPQKTPEEAKEENSSKPEPGEQEASSEEEGETSGEELRQDEVSRKEAELMLQQYQQKEEPQGLLNFMKYKGKDSPVLRDW